MFERPRLPGPELAALKMPQAARCSVKRRLKMRGAGGANCVHTPLGRTGRPNVAEPMDGRERRVPDARLSRTHLILFKLAARPDRLRWPLRIRGGDPDVIR